MIELRLDKSEVEYLLRILNERKEFKPKLLIHKFKNALEGTPLILGEEE